VDHAKREIPFEDEDVSDFVLDNLTQNGVEIIHSAKLRKILNKAEYLQVVLDFKERHSEVIEADAVFITIGRYLDRSGLGLGNIGIDISKSGILKADQKCCVKDNIYTAGDKYPSPGPDQM
jgi:dihydrolipoamide dehydrogenase